MNDAEETRGPTHAGEHDPDWTPGAQYAARRHREAEEARHYFADAREAATVAAEAEAGIGAGGPVSTPETRALASCRALLTMLCGAAVEGGYNWHEFAQLPEVATAIERAHWHPTDYPIAVRLQWREPWARWQGRGMGIKSYEQITLEVVMRELLDLFFVTTQVPRALMLTAGTVTARAAALVDWDGGSRDTTTGIPLQATERAASGVEDAGQGDYTPDRDGTVDPDYEQRIARLETLGTERLDRLMTVAERIEDHDQLIRQLAEVSSQTAEALAGLARQLADRPVRAVAGGHNEVATLAGTVEGIQRTLEDHRGKIDQLRARLGAEHDRTDAVEAAAVRLNGELKAIRTIAGTQGSRIADLDRAHDTRLSGLGTRLAVLETKRLEADDPAEWGLDVAGLRDRIAALENVSAAGREVFDVSVKYLDPAALEQLTAAISSRIGAAIRRG